MKKERNYEEELERQYERDRRNFFRKIGIAIFIIVIILFATLAIARVPPGHRGVLLTWGKVEPTVLPEGITIITPIMHTYQPLSIQTQKYSAQASSASKDLQIVTTEVTLNYRLKPNQVNDVYQKLSLDYTDRVIQPAIQEIVKASTARFTAEELITKRELVKLDIENGLIVRLNKFGGIEAQTVSITDFQFSPEFNDAIELKVTAEQQALKAENDLTRIKTEAQQRIAQAQAEAESIRIQAQALKENPQLISLRWVEKWNGILPKFMMGDSSSMLLFDLSEFDGE